MASSHAHHAHPHRYPPHPNSHSNSNANPSHVPSSDFRLPPLKSLNFQYRPPQQHDAPSAPDQPSYTAFDVSQDVNGSAPSHAAGAPSAPTTNGTSFSAFGYPTPTPTSATSAPAYVHRQPFAFQGQASSQSQQQHDHDTWQQQHPHGPNTTPSAHSQTPSQMHAQVPSQQTSSFARTTPLVPTTVDPPSTASARAPSAFPAPPPKHRSTYLPQSPYTPNTSHPYNPSYPPSSNSASAPYAPYSTSGYTANTTSPTFGPSAPQSYPSASANTPSSYPSHNAYPTPTSAYPHRPPSPTPTPTQPPQQHPHAHSPSHYVPPPTSASAYAFDDTRSSTAYENQAPPVRGHPQVQDARDSRVPIPDRARYPHAQPKPADARIDSRHEMYSHPTGPTSVPPSAAVDARHSQSYSQHETRPGYSHPTDSSRPGTSYAQGQSPAHVPLQAHAEVARSYPPEPRTTAYTQDTKYTYPQSLPPEPSARAGAGFPQDPPTRVGYPPEGPTRPPHAPDSRSGYPHGQETHGNNNRGTSAPYVAEPRQPSGYVSAQDTRHAFGSSEASTVPSSYVPAEQRRGPPAPPQYVPSNADQRPSFGDSRSAGGYPGNAEPSRSGYTAPDSVSVPAIVPLPRPPPPPPPSHLPRQNGQPHGYSSSLSFPPQHTAQSYNSSPVSAPSTALPHSQSQSYIPPSQPVPHPSHSSHLSQPPHGPLPAQTVHATHPAQAQAQPSHSLPHSQTQPQMHHPEPPRPAFVSPADTMHAREARFPMSALAEDERERERREREREREREERERERELEREREREKRERESQREREKERERLAELREKEQKERERDREREGVMREVLEHCTVLYQFATRYAQSQSSTPLAQPSAQELAEMTHRAQEVVRLLESLRSPSSGKLANASTASSSLGSASAPHSSAFGDRTSSHAALSASGPSSGAPIDLDTRAPKRPWEETQTSSTLPHVSQLHLLNSPAGTGQANGQTAAERIAAEKDMEIIRTKRALTTSLAAAAAAGGGTGSVAGAVGGAVGAGKSKYRKRSRATPPGKCHSCNIRETPEWRRGPDGARTLCNACGLHYAKLVRKRDKALAAEGGSGTVMRIDMDMLRASARAAENERAARAAAGGANVGGSSASGPNGNADMDKMSVHTGSFQIVPMNMNIDGESGSGSGQGQAQQGAAKTQAQTQPQQPQPQPSTSQLPPPAGSSGTPHLHSLGHPLPSPHAQGNAHYSHSSNQARTHSGPPLPPWASKAYGQEMQHPQQSFVRTSHSVSSGASPPR